MYFFAILNLCLILISFIVVITFPIMMVMKGKKERDRENMNLFDNSSDEVQKKQPNTRWMGTAVIVAAIYLIMTWISLSIPIPALPVTAIISVAVIISRSHHYKKSVKSKNQKDSR